MLAWIGLYSCSSSQIFGEVCELAIDASEPGSSQRFLDHLLELSRYEALQPAKALELQYVAKSFYLPASERRGLGIATHKAQFRDRLHVDTVPDGPILFHSHQGDGNRGTEQVGQLVIGALRGLVLTVQLLNRGPILLGRLAQGNAPHLTVSPCLPA